MDKYINPQTGDYDGTKIDNLSNAVFLRITTPLGSYWADPQMGSKLHLLARSKDQASVLPIAIAYTKQALQPLLDSKRAVSIDVIGEWLHDGILRLYTTIIQAGGVSQVFENFVRVG